MSNPDAAGHLTGEDGGVPGHVIAVHLSDRHGFSKEPAPAIDLVEGLGVQGDAHFGVTVQHRSRVAADPSQPNLRQVHVIHAELFDDLAIQGHAVAPGQLGENITTRGLNLLDLPVGTRLTLGDAVLVLTGLRNPCQQINGFQAGLLKCVVSRKAAGTVKRLAGVMAIVARSGTVVPGQGIVVDLPPEPHFALARV